VESLDEYIDSHKIPILKEWCVANKVPANHIYDYEGFSESIKRCIDKKEAGLERGALNGEINNTMAIFSLKQLGWSDKREIEHSGSVSIGKEFDGV